MKKPTKNKPRLVQSREARILLFDIESTNLRADFGYILCISWKHLGEKKIHTAAITSSPHYNTDPTDDSWILQKFAKVFNEADIAVAHYGIKFDRRFINTRLLYHHLPPLPQVAFVDTWRIAKDNLAMSSNRLASIVGFFGLPEKTPVKGGVWLKAMCGHRQSVKYIVDHCEADIIALEAAYLKLRPLMHNHPNVNLVSGKEMCCPKCGSMHLMKNGFRIARSRVMQKYSCYSCGGSSLGPSEKVMQVDAR